MNILFMCVANSARSQLAEGLAKNILGNKVKVESAGSKPAKVNPLAIESLKEVGINIESHWSKSTEDLSPDFLDKLDYVITLCAEEVCPVIISKAKKLHWPLPDPAGHDELSHEERLELFRKTRSVIHEKLMNFKAEHNL